MAILQVKDIDDRLYQSLKQKAAAEKRSVSQEIILLIEKYLSNPESFERNPTKEFLQMAGSWSDNRSEKEIVEDILASRVDSQRFGTTHELFD